MTETTLQHLHRLPVSMIPILLNPHADASRPIKLRSRSDLAACAVRVGFRLGLVKGCIENRVLYL